MAEKARYWVALLYPENMPDDWEQGINGHGLGDILEVPFAYCLHDHDLKNDGDDDKKHVHMILAFPNTTTKNHALKVFNRLDPTIKIAFPVINIRHKYEYLIHNTEDCRKKHKYQYPPDCRITGNNFDIQHYEQVSIEQKNEMRRELANFLLDNHFYNYSDFYKAVLVGFASDPVYEEICCTWHGFFSSLCKGEFHKFKIKNDNSPD